jgi:SAM-dependent methyltransferase
MNSVNTDPIQSPFSIFHPASSIHLACPVCRTSLSSSQADHLPCPSCGFVLRLVDGIWRALPSERMSYYQQFIHDYETIRLAEGRGTGNPSYYLSLPYRDSTGNLDWQWQIRGTTYRYVENNVWPKIEKRYPHGFDLLDIGAGNGWLSYRVAIRGHRPVAVDLVLNQFDGLGASRHYWPVLKQSFPCFQAEMDHLPFVGGQFDVIVFNASIHYSANYLDTLKEGLRCLRPLGHLLVMDSPLYHAEASGRQMVEKRHRQFEEQYGFRSDSVPSLEYLTFNQVKSLSNQLGLSWKILRPWYGAAWGLRPLKAWLKGGREPSKFHVLWGRRA